MRDNRIIHSNFDMHRYVLDAARCPQTLINSQNYVPIVSQRETSFEFLKYARLSEYV